MGYDVHDDGYRETAIVNRAGPWEGKSDLVIVMVVIWRIPEKDHARRSPSLLYFVLLLGRLTAQNRVFTSDHDANVSFGRNVP